MRVAKTNFINFTRTNFKSRENKAVGIDDSNAAAIHSALEELKKIKFENNDLIYIQTIGAKPPFKSGLEAYEFIKRNNVGIRFSKLPLDDVHASWDYTENAILINEKYKNSKSFPEILALSEAIFHEAGHAKDRDMENSIQEELDCLALNVLGHKFHQKTYRDVFVGQNSFLFSQGVNLYERLFYQFGTRKQDLKARVNDKYGFLQIESKNHPASQFAMDIKNYKH